MKQKLLKIQLLILLFIFLFVPVSYAEDILKLADECKSYFVMENNSKQVLLDYNAQQEVAIASLTKIMTFSVVMDHINDGTIQLTDTVTIDEITASKPGSSLELKKGEVITVNDLLKGLMVVSGNDAAYALAVKTAGSEKDFVKMMNEKAEAIGLSSYSFYNASGYPLDDGRENMMNAKDLAKLAGYVLEEYPQITNYSQIRVLDMPERGFSKHTTIPLLDTVRGVDGLKTGTTDAAGFCLITTMNLKDNPDHRIVAVLMGTDSIRTRNTLQGQILNFIAERYKPVKIIDKNKLFTSTVVNSCQERVIGLQPARDYDGLFDESIRVYKKVDLNPVIKAPIKKGDILGKVTVYIGNEGKEEIDLIADKDYKQADTLTRLKRCLGYSYRLVVKLLQG